MIITIFACSLEGVVQETVEADLRDRPFTRASWLNDASAFILELAMTQNPVPHDAAK